MHLLTTRDGFNADFTPTKLLELMPRWLAQYPFLGDIELRVLPREVLHDRFLRVDGHLYTLGNSLNSLGDRASLVLRIPDPDPVFRELDELWRRAESLADFAARRGGNE